jgi:hypothetical protein
VLAVHAQKGPALPDVLKAAGDYLADYSKKLGVVAADEEFTQRDNSSGLGSARRLNSDVVFAGFDNGLITVSRDAYSVDGQSRRTRDDRLMTAFTTKPALAAVHDGQDFTEATAHEYMSPNLRLLDDPTLALQFIRKENQEHSTFKLDSVKTMNGAQVAILKYNEKVTPRLVQAPEGAPASGRFWVDIATGAIRQTELVFSSGNYNIRVTVTFTEDPTLKMWLPSESYQQLDFSAGGGGMNPSGSSGNYGAHQSLEGRAKYSKFRQGKLGGE